MKTSIVLFASILLLQFNLCAQEFLPEEQDTTTVTIEEIEASLQYQTGTIQLERGNATLNVPKGYGYLDQEQSMYVLTELWGNPEDFDVLGMLVPEGLGVLGESSWAYVIEYDEIGYVKDGDADDIDYADLLKDLQKETEQANAHRAQMGYEAVHLVGWASHPYYDKEKKVLHWAKELQFGDYDENTLNYNLRILGRKGVFVLNAVASMNELDEVKATTDAVLASVTFNNGNRYADFNPDVDEVAAWTIGGLVAGKILAKAGILAGLLKFWKLIAIGIVAGGGAIWRFIKGRKKEEEETSIVTTNDPTV
jgi:uncharacterized membrane-anchored protein